MKIIKPEELNVNLMDAFKNSWALLTCSTKECDNTMTIAWGQAGHIWNKFVVTCYVRESRFTKHMMDESECYSISFFDESYKEKLTHAGRTSRRDEDKIETLGITKAYEDDVMYLKEAKLTFILKKIYSVDLPCNKLPKETIERYYLDNDIHTEYIGEIQKIIVND